MHPDIADVLAGRRRWCVPVGDCREVLASMPDGSARCCVTSPPYWGLRDYGTARWEGGDPACDHAKGTAASARSTLKNDGRENFGSNNYERSIVVPYRDACGKCGAIRVDGQLGLESTPEEYVAGMVAVFREVRRVLADDGSLWLNLGDSYAGPKGNTRGEGAGGGKERGEAMGFGGAVGKTPIPHGLKPKDLVGIPWRVAFALQADGWWLRQDIIWAKPNPMPESVTDRCTKAHEYVFLLAKAERYFYDAEAIKEKCASEPHSPGNLATKEGGHMRNDYGTDAMERVWGADGKRNRRSVWTVNSHPFPDAHFATYPPKLIEPCILAGSEVGDIVIDPFNGAGTTGLVSVKHGRRYIGAELNPAYADIARRRIAEADTHLFNREAP